MASEVRRFTSFTAQIDRASGRPVETRKTIQATPSGTITMPESAPVSIMLQHAPGGERKALEAGIAAAATRATVNPPKWRLMVKHPSGSLEAAVSSVRRRNLLVSSGILGILGVSIGFLVVSTRRAQDLARQQMEFVAAVSHELAGLGLSLVQRIVEAHGGRITLRSAPGSGSEFTVHLPSAAEQPAARSSAATDAARTSA